MKTNNEAITEVIKGWGYDTNVSEITEDMRDSLSRRYTRNLKTNEPILWNKDVVIIPESVHSNWRYYTGIEQMGIQPTTLTEEGVFIYHREMGEVVDNIIFLFNATNAQIAALERVNG